VEKTSPPVGHQERFKHLGKHCQTRTPATCRAPRRAREERRWRRKRRERVAETLDEEGECRGHRADTGWTSCRTEKSFAELSQTECDSTPLCLCFTSGPGPFGGSIIENCFRFCYRKRFIFQTRQE
jgi:hypothetical protein